MNTLPLELILIIKDYLNLDDIIKLYSVLRIKKYVIMYNNLKKIKNIVEKDKELYKELYTLSIFTHPLMKKNRIRKGSLTRLSVECCSCSYNIFELSKLIKKYLKKSSNIEYKTDYTLSLKLS